MNINAFPPGPDLYLAVRGGFVTQGLTLTRWCNDREINPTNARAALVGAWNGPKGKALRARLIEESGISQPSQTPLKSASKGVLPMARVSWKNRQPTSLRHGMELCMEYARVKHNRSIDHIADLMGLPNRWVLYKWLENGRLPSILIRPFEAACGCEYVTRYIGHSAHKLLIDIPSGRKATGKSINDLQASFTEAVSLLLKFYEGDSPADETLAALFNTMEELAWHHGSVERHQQPEFELQEDSND
jgi:hypothetical protein